jgi:DNA-directed RNA polymerase beta subunit
VKFAVPTFSEIGQEQISQLAEQAGLDRDLQVKLYDGRTGEEFANKITV